ncbi:MAG: 5'-nucleotidase, partial [Verrucomicrobiota bacterium]
MPVDLSEQIVLGISSSALFDTKREHEIYESHGRDEYVRYQVENEEKPFPRGPAFPLVRAMLRLNDNFDLSRRIEVVVMSQNQPEAGLRVMNSIREYGLENLGISRGCFTGGTPVSKYLSAYNVSLFLSRHREDVQEAIKNGFAAAVLYDSPDSADIVPNQVRLAFDGDAVIFSGESEKIYQAEGIEVFHENERRNAKVPMQKGPFAEFLKLINEVQHGIEDEENFPIRTAIVTARSGPADRRVIHTLRDYGIKVDELFFMGGVEKKAVLKAFRPHSFFDDQPVHDEPASSVVQS